MSEIKKQAGWWAINQQGQMIRPSVDKGSLLNAIPNVDEKEKHYLGDGPADIMDEALRNIDAEYRIAWGRSPTFEELEALFNFCTGPFKKDPEKHPLSTFTTDLEKALGLSYQVISRVPKQYLDEWFKWYRQIGSNQEFATRKNWMEMVAFNFDYFVKGQEEFLRILQEDGLK